MWTEEKIMKTMTNPLYEPDTVWSGIFTYMLVLGAAALLLIFLLMIWIGTVPLFIGKLLATFILVGSIGGIALFFRALIDM